MTTTSGQALRPGDERYRKVRKFDWWLAAASVLLLVVGLMAQYSADHGTGSSRNFWNHLIRIGIGVVPFLIMYRVNPKFWQRQWAVLYGVNITVLLAVLFVGKRAGGAQRWIQFGPLEFQPSEMAKLLVALTLSAFFAAKQDSVKSFSTFLLSLLHVGPPLALIFLQPHLGATLVVLVIWASISLVAGVPIKYLAGTIVAAAALIGVAFTVPGILKDYQKDRIIGLFHKDDENNTFQVMRAEIAIGAGGVTGAGFTRGEWRQGGFVPEQNTDFIFTIIAEEGGLVGSTLVLAAFAFFLYRAWLVMYRAFDPFAQMACAGMIGMIGFHTVVNLGMNLQLLPVVGLWLPFVSYGGTMIWLLVACVGFLLNVRSRERPLLF